MKEMPFNIVSGGAHRGHAFLGGPNAQNSRYFNADGTRKMFILDKVWENAPKGYEQFDTQRALYLKKAVSKTNQGQRDSEANQTEQKEEDRRESGEPGSDGENQEMEDGQKDPDTAQ